MSLSIENLKLSFVKSLQEDPYSCIKKISSDYMLLLHPINLKEIKKGIANELNSMIKSYVEEFKGILMGYEGVKVTSTSGWLFDTNPFVHISLFADFYIFAPTIGSILRGKVVKKSPNHVGCLVHGIFNASSSIPRELRRDEWCGSSVSEGDLIDLKISELNLGSIVPYVLGDIDPDSVCKTSSSSQDGSKNKRIVFNDDDSGIGSIDKSISEEHVPTKKKTHKQGTDCLDDVKEEKEGDQETPKKKSKDERRHSRSQGAIVGTVEVDSIDNSISEEHVPTKKKKKKKKTHEQEGTDCLDTVKEAKESDQETPKKKTKDKAPNILSQGTIVEYSEQELSLEKKKKFSIKKEMYDQYSEQDIPTKKKKKSSIVPEYEENVNVYIKKEKQDLEETLSVGSSKKRKRNTVDSLDTEPHKKKRKK